MSMHQIRFWCLTRRANQRHIFIIADILELAADEQAAGFFISGGNVRKSLGSLERRPHAEFLGQ